MASQFKGSSLRLGPLVQQARQAMMGLLASRWGKSKGAEPAPGYWSRAREPTSRYCQSRLIGGGRRAPGSASPARIFCAGMSLTIEACTSRAKKSGSRAGFDWSAAERKAMVVLLAGGGEERGHEGKSTERNRRRGGV